MERLGGSLCLGQLPINGHCYWARAKPPPAVWPIILPINIVHFVLQYIVYRFIHPPLHLHIGPLPASFEAKWNVFQSQGLISERAILGPDKIEAMINIMRCPASLHLRVPHLAWRVDRVSRLPQQVSQTLLSTHLFPHAQDRQFAHGAHHISDHRPCQVLDMNAPI